MLFSSCLAFAAIFVSLVAAAPSRQEEQSSSSDDLSEYAQSLFDYSMSIQDVRWDDSYKFIWFRDKGQWSTRFTAWYTAGLLKRNQGNDAENAKAALRNIIMTQMTENFTSEWYGTFKNSPDQPDPTPDSGLYPPEIYTTYDPNWREFIGTQLVQVVEEFEPLLGSDLVREIETSLSIAAVGEMRRNGTAPDNLITGYSNPGLMRALVVGWIGHRLGNQTFIDFANEQGTLISDLFKQDGANTLGEYNAPTYYGMDAWALAANIKYGPPNATMTLNSPYILTHLFTDIADHYNPYLGNLAGPYDRAYTRDLTTHSAVISLFFWGLFGRSSAPIPPLGEADLLFDASQGAALSLIMSTVSSHLTPSTITALSGGPNPSSNLTATSSTPSTDIKTLFPPRFLRRTIYSTFSPTSPYVRSRNTTTYISPPLTLGAESVFEPLLPPASSGSSRGEQFVPAIIHWASDPKHRPFPYVGFISLYPTSNVINASVSSDGTRLRVEYPLVTNNTSSDDNSTTMSSAQESFQFLISGLPPSWTLQTSSSSASAGAAGAASPPRNKGQVGLSHQKGIVTHPWSNLPCLKVEEVGMSEGLKRLETKYGTQVEGHWVYNVTYVVAGNGDSDRGNRKGKGEGLWIELGVEYTC